MHHDPAPAAARGRAVGCPGLGRPGARRPHYPGRGHAGGAARGRAWAGPGRPRAGSADRTHAGRDHAGPTHAGPTRAGRRAPPRCVQSTQRGGHAPARRRPAPGLDPASLLDAAARWTAWIPGGSPAATPPAAPPTAAAPPARPPVQPDPTAEAESDTGAAPEPEGDAGAAGPPPPAADAAGPDAPPAQATGLSAQLLHDAGAVARLLAPGSLLQLSFLLLVAGAAFAVFSALARAVRRAGFDVLRRLTGLQLLVTLLLAVWVGERVARHLLDEAPLLASVVTVVFAATLAGTLAWRLQQVVVGGALTLRGNLRAGDRVTLGDATATLERVGLLRMRLRSDDGAIVFVPLRALAEETVTVASPTRTQAVTVQLTTDAPPTALDRERWRRVAVACPYREAGSRVWIENDGPSTTLVRVHIQVWGVRAVDAARDWLEDRLRQPVA